MKPSALAALRVQVQAIARQAQLVDEQLQAMEEQSDDDEEEEHDPCPRCGKREFASAGEIDVCAGCNANVRHGENGLEVVDG